MSETVNNSDCNAWFDECNDRANITLLQLFRLLTKKGANGCPVLATDAAVSIGDVTIDLAATNVLLAAIQSLLTPAAVTKETRNVIAAGAGAIAIGARRVDIVNYDSADALVDGVVLPSGLSLAYVAGENNTLPAFTYDAQTSKLFITIIR